MTHRIVIVGGGAGGLELATRLGNSLGKRGKAQITLIDANLTHIWKPLLHEVAAGSLNTSDDELNYLAQAKWNHFEFQLGRMCGLDREAKSVQLEALQDENGNELVASRSISYDSLVIAVGSTTNDFGTPGAKDNCIFLDTRAQAERFHRKLLRHYMRSHAQQDTQQSIKVAIIGAGATGVELSAELHHAARELKAYGFKGIEPEDLRITLVEASPRVLPALPDRIAGPVTATLRRLGVTVLTGSAVSEVTPEGLKLQNGQEIPATIKVWAAGIRAPRFLAGIGGLESNRLNQLMVKPTLQTTLDEHIYALGDCAACALHDNPERFVPPRAQAAHQMASLLAKSFKAKLAGKALPEFRYRDYGSLISLSSFSAVGNLMGNLTGDVMLEGRMARWFYVSLYRLHQAALFGWFRTLLLMASDRLGRSTEPRLKLH
ncbi:NADH dehydrogenase [Atopomonas hussainii]|uniref:NADH dehydrogenase n=1 Tax=Atopomonas hussainii TaxID=1429083 RepID=A0A1H7QWW4_9GAMM|nr:NAD(P)/FAD-dependent oxidoreductase [Atopomonas hussainii]SEL51787.1 NADH dehydrogenase [Atopomonas hussainii]